MGSRSNFMEKSIRASDDHVFLTWHDIEFLVPSNVKPNETERSLSYLLAIGQGDRKTLLDKHQDNVSNLDSPKTENTPNRYTENS